MNSAIPFGVITGAVAIATVFYLVGAAQTVCSGVENPLDHEGGALKISTSCPVGSSILSIRQKKSGSILRIFSRRTLYFHLVGGPDAILYLKGDGNVVLCNAPPDDDDGCFSSSPGFYDDVNANEKWKVLDGHPGLGTLSGLYTLLREMDARGELLRYNLVDRNCATFASEIFKIFFLLTQKVNLLRTQQVDASMGANTDAGTDASTITDAASTTLPHLNTATATTATTQPLASAPPATTPLATTPPTTDAPLFPSVWHPPVFFPAPYRSFPAPPPGWIDGSRLT